MDKRCRNAFDTLCMSEEKKEQVFEDICEKCEKRKRTGFRKSQWQHVFWRWLFRRLELRERRYQRMLCL